MNKLNFNELDQREFTLIENNKYKIILFQVDILRLINLCETVNSKNLANKLRRAIYLKDYENNTKTNFNRKLPKSEIESFIFSPKQLLHLKLARDQLDKNIEIYYK